MSDDLLKKLGSKVSQVGARMRVEKLDDAFTRLGARIRAEKLDERVSRLGARIRSGAAGLWRRGAR